MIAMIDMKENKKIIYDIIFHIYFVAVRERNIYHNIIATSRAFVAP